MSTSTVSPSNFELAPCRVTFNGVDLGGTSGGVKVSLKTKTADIKADQYGDTVIDTVVSGVDYMVTLTLAEYKSKDNWKVAFPYNKLVTSGPNKMVYFDTQIGAHLLDYANALILHPLSKVDSDLSGDFKFFKAVAKAATEVTFGPDKQLGLQIEFMILPDSSASPAKFLIHGDPTIGVVSAAAAAAVAGANTGNGTCGSISAGSKTATETITITCIGVNGANKSAWKVVGSVSGAIGTVEMTGGAGGTGVFTSNYVNFTLTDGATDFIVNDSFTIATTAANYA